jgi:hypothetical protein
MKWRSDLVVLSGECRLTSRWSGRVENELPSSYIGGRAAQLNR